MPPSSGSQTQFANSQRGKKILKLFPQNFAEDQQPDFQETWVDEIIPQNPSGSLDLTFSEVDGK